MKCPFCQSVDTQVKDSRATEDGATIRRRRHCNDCGARFTTFERVQLREIMVVKSNGEKELFERDKLFRSVSLPLRKRPVDPEKVESLISAVIRELESCSDGDVTSKEIGALVMEHLVKLDQVAFVRYASVYKDFRQLSDFISFVEDLNEK